MDYDGRILWLTYERENRLAIDNYQKRRAAGA